VSFGRPNRGIGRANEAALKRRPASPLASLSVRSGSTLRALESGPRDCASARSAGKWHGSSPDEALNDDEVRPSDALAHPTTVVRTEMTSNRSE